MMFLARARCPSIFQSSWPRPATTTTSILPGLRRNPHNTPLLSPTHIRLLSTANPLMHKDLQTPPDESHSDRLQERDEKAQDSHEGFLGQNRAISGSSKIDRDGRIAPSSHEEAEMVFNHPLEDGIVAEAFNNHEYLDTKRIVDPTLQTLQKMARQWTPDKYLAPSTSLVATSKGGKSRLLKELSRRTCVVYICLRPQHSSGYPPRSEYPAGVLLDSKCPTLQT
ncbi:hypothetical protein PGT21_016047 [Puccinia graminis f. sp. tritici]|uniref:Uncharacterized protein n=1 Tax=Puccinia graminis f. sp. tritici TaxID=56615 RepID=A0A5B0PDW0_PUCGR|nr:hypothetical protein PGTUg99_009959 [Puccinia graminis f. sp. tritici]KAA1105701.1 hypothetical protein PGT21_016047 [Puccinia graminis f. sp. tritici]